MVRRGCNLLLAAHLAAGVVVASISVAAQADAPYRLSPGDVVEIALAGMPEQRQRASVQIDGTIVLPAIGSVAVAGLTVAALQARMEALLPTKMLRYRAPDGREQFIIIKPGDVAASIVEYRPVYVSGDVLTPGQQPYRPMMTVRQAVAVAGGYSLLRARAIQPGFDLADLRRDHDALWNEYVKEHFHALRARAELDDRDSFDQSAPKNSPLPSTAIYAIAQPEAQALKVALADNNLERAFLERAAKETDEQIVMLGQREIDEERGVQLDVQELERATKLYGSGSLPSPRVAEIRRALLFSSTRRLQTSIELMRAKRQRDEYGRQLERATNQRRVNLLGQLRDSNARMTDLGVKIQAASQKLQPALGGATAPFVGDSSRPEVLIMRKVDQQWQRIAAAEEAEMQPGDVIEVAFRRESAVGTAVH